MSATDNCDSQQLVTGKDFDTYDCTLGGTLPDFNKSAKCWNTVPSLPLQRIVKCFSIQSDGTTLTVADDASCTQEGSYDVYFVNALDPKTATNVCQSNTDPANMVPCKFQNTAADLADVTASVTCTGCTACPKFVIGIASPWAPGQ